MGNKFLLVTIWVSCFHPFLDILISFYEVLIKFTFLFSENGYGSMSEDPFLATQERVSLIPLETTVLVLNSIVEITSSYFFYAT